jgi:riboflavin kinase
MTELLKPYFVSGKVVKGFGRGSKQLGISTANIESSVVQKIDIQNGIYFGFAQLLSPQKDKKQMSSTCEPNGSQINSNGISDSNSSQINANQSNESPIYPMVCSLGWNPHFNNTIRSLEVHILKQFGYDFYDSILRVAICGYIRSEQKFDNLEKLIEAIHNDIKFAEQELKDHQKWSHVLNDNFFKDCCS